MAEVSPLGLLLEALRSVVGVLRSSGERGVIIGGVAVALQAQPRFTQDVDLMILDEGLDLSTFLRQAAAFDLVPRRSDALQFARDRRVLLLRHETSQRGVDVSLGLLPFEREVIENARVVEVYGLSVPVASPADLIIMKAVAHRGRDSMDIESLMEVHGDIDLTRVRRWVKEFASVLEMPELIEDLETLLDRRRRRSSLQRRP